MLDEKDWEAIITLVAERRIPALDANGQMTDAVIERIVQLDHVTRLELGGSGQLTDAGVRHLTHLPRLQHLDLSGTGITDRGLLVLRTNAGVAFLAALPRLREVILDGCRQITPEAAVVFPAQVRVDYSV